jgi:hypothetical protein
VEPEPLIFPWIASNTGGEPFVAGMLDAPKHLARTVNDLYFDQKYDLHMSPAQLQLALGIEPKTPLRKTKGK